MPLSSQHADNFLQFPAFCFAGDAKSRAPFRPALPFLLSHLLLPAGVTGEERALLCFPRATAFSTESVSELPQETSVHFKPCPLFLLCELPGSWPALWLRGRSSLPWGSGVC